MAKRVNQQRECFSCKKHFGPKHVNQIYCSYTCASSSGRLDKICELCGSSYLPPRMQWEGKYCSNKCATVAQGHRGPTKWSDTRKNVKIHRVCIFCNSEFHSPHAAKKYCNQSCAKLAGKERAAVAGRVRFTLKSKEHKEWIDTRNRILAEQENKCAICKISLGDHKRANLDHSHKNGKIRGVLCTQCNHAIGLLRDDIEIIKTAATYLESYA